MKRIMELERRALTAERDLERFVDLLPTQLHELYELGIGTDFKRDYRKITAEEAMKIATDNADRVESLLNKEVERDARGGLKCT
jgi:hypothetical protein